MRAFVLAFLLAATFPISATQDKTQAESTEDVVGKACRVALAKGFTFSIQVGLDMPDSLPRDRAALAGSALKGAYEDGTFHVSDGTYEIYGRGAAVAVKTARGWLPLEQYLAPLRQQIHEGFDDELWRRGNVTQAKKALDEHIRISHLLHRGNCSWLSRAAQAFDSFRKVKGDASNGAFEGDLTDHAAFNLLQGPFEELVKRGTLSFQNVSGIGRITLKNGQVDNLRAKAAGKWSYYNDDDNIKRKGICTLEFLVDLTKIGETKLEIPAEVSKLIAK